MTVKRENLIQIEDKLYQKCKVHLLPTDKEGKLRLNNNGKLSFEPHIKGLSYDGLIHTYQHIYITSDEKIEEGDWILNFAFKEQDPLLQKCMNNSEAWRWNNEPMFKYRSFKIITTTDTSLKITKYNDDEHPIDSYSYLLPQPSQEFINRYIEGYNKGEQIVDILVEYMSFQNDRDGIYYNPRIDKNNCITIKKVKDSWSREEVSELIHKYEKDMLYYGRDGYYNDCFPKVTDKWILENL